MATGSPHKGLKGRRWDERWNAPHPRRRGVSAQGTDGSPLPSPLPTLRASWPLARLDTVTRGGRSADAICAAVLAGEPRRETAVRAGLLRKRARCDVERKI
ncbi:hypothetical protein AAFF_G00389550 [Aldrovandia affinis]|uniref:Uncharacterized protein n=1 Tax=Aldrovandia affinis TaxID=143900 RepID=A0AAD7SEP7_9TELE|nr:hypothetical protein AAFF_G00389550 [Aldrovandia affinis]